MAIAITTYENFHLIYARSSYKLAKVAALVRVCEIGSNLRRACVDRAKVMAAPAAGKGSQDGTGQDRRGLRRGNCLRLTVSSR